MAQFTYKAKEGPSKVVEGSVEAPSKELAIKKLEMMGLFPMKVEESASKKEATTILKKSKGRISQKEITVFTRQLGTLIKSGVPILKALGVLSEQAQTQAFKDVVSEMYSKLKEGQDFSYLLSRYPRLFSPFYVAMAKAGEDSGKLETVLFRIADYRQSEEDLVSKIKLALIYPVIMLIVGAGTIFFILTFVMPRLMRIFGELGQALPPITRILITISTFLSKWWVPVLVGIVLLCFLIRFQLRTKYGRRIVSIVGLKIPIIGDLFLKQEIARLSRSFQLLLTSGIPMLKAMELTIPIVDNVLIKEKLRQGYQELKQGASFAKTIKGFSIFPPFMINLISIGEESGKLELAFTELADAYEKDTGDQIKAFTTTIEPLMILSMGLVVGFVVVAMLLPIFQINLIIK